MKILLTILEATYIIICIYNCYSKKLKLSHYLKTLFFDYGVLNILLINLMFFLIFNSAPKPLPHTYYYDIYYSTERVLYIILFGAIVYYSAKMFLEIANNSENQNSKERKTNETII